MSSASMPVQTKRATPARLALWLALGILSLTVWLFWPATGYELVDLDDLTYIHQNQIVRDGFSWPALRMAFTEIWHGMWAPGLWLSYMFDIKLYGLEAWGFHFTNLLLHALNAALVFALFWGWTRKPWRAFWAAAFWAWHPLRIESVVWVAERKDVLSGLFFLLCVGTYWLSRQETETNRIQRGVLFGTSALMLGLGLLVKPTLMMTPGVLLLLDFWPLHRVRLAGWAGFRALPRLILEKWGFWIMALGAAGMSMHAHALAGAVIDLSWTVRLKMVPLNCVFYLLKTIRPINLTVLYEPLYFFRTDFIFALVTMGGLTLWAWRKRHHQGSLLVGWVWFLVLLVPVIGLIRFGAQSVADRFTYLPAIGLSLALIQLFPGKNHAIWRWIRAILGGVILLWMATTSRHQLPAWKNSVALYENLLRYFPASPMGLHYRSMKQIRQGEAQAAEATIAPVILRNPQVEVYRYAKVLAMSAQGAGAAAKEWLIAHPPPPTSSILGYWEWHLGQLSLQLGQSDEALRYAQEALEKMPVNDTSRNDVILLGMTASFKQGDQASAQSWAHQWMPYRDKTPITQLDLMPFYLRQWEAGQRQEAMTYFRHVRTTLPNNVEWLNNLAWILATAAWGPAEPQEAVEYARRALVAAGGDHPILLDTLGAALAQAGDYAAALECVEKALTLTRASGQATSEFARNIEKRRQQYRQGQPWREADAAGRLLQSYDDR